MNPCDACVANKTIAGKQMTIAWHVDDTKASHVDPRMNDWFIAWVDRKCEDDEIGRVTATRGFIHPCSEMTLDYFKKGAVTMNMKDCVKDMVKVFEEDFEYQLTGGTASSLSDHHPFEQDKESPKLENEMAERFHFMIVKALFASKRARPDTSLTVSVLCTRVKDANEFE